MDEAYLCVAGAYVGVDLSVISLNSWLDCLISGTNYRISGGLSTIGFMRSITTI